MKKLGFVGGGRVTRIICRGLALSGALPPTVVYDSSAEALSSLSSAGLGLTVTERLEDALAAEILVLAVHPAVMADLLPALGGRISQSTVVLSLSPKISLSRTQELLGGHRLVARMNPNAPSIVGKGFNPISFSAEFDASRKRELLAVFAPLGRTPVVEDGPLESFAVITAMGPTYLDYQIGLLRELALRFGIPAELASEGLRAMVAGAAETVLADGIGENPLDLVPVRPLKEIEEAVTRAYLTRLPERLAMLKG